MYKPQSHTGFTLVEIIVAVVILAILAVVGFMSYSSYFVNSRDAARIADMTKTVEVLQSYALENKLPLPDDVIYITLSGSVAGYQGKLGKNVRNVLDLSDDFVDPKDKHPYTYFVSRDRKGFQFLVFMEQNSDYQLFMNSTYALDYIGRYPRTFGDSLGVFTETETNIPLEDLSLSGSVLELENIGTGQLLSSHLSGNEYVTGDDDRFTVLPDVIDSKGRGWVVEGNEFRCYDPNTDGRCSTTQEFITYDRPTNASMGLVPRGGAPAISTVGTSSSTSSTSGGGTPPVIGFESTWKTDNQGLSADNQIRLPLVAGGNYNFTVDWESDGIIDDTITSYNQLEVLHTYDKPGIYTVNIVGTLEGFNFVYAFDNGFNTDRNKIIEISNWGGIVLGNEGGVYSDIAGNFGGTENLNITASDSPDLSNQYNLSYMFAASGIQDTDLTSWDISNVTNLNATFWDSDFSGDISKWDTSNVTEMDSTFHNTKAFNGDINTKEVTVNDITYTAWDTSSVTTMSAMFYESKAFNRSIGNWDITNLTNLSYMFQSSELFNQELNTKEVTIGGNTYIAWDVKGITNVNQMFAYSRVFNGDISNWNLSGISSPLYIFYRSAGFNNDVSTKVINLGGYIYTAWDASPWTSAGRVFQDAAAFNQPLNSWDVSNMTSLLGIIGPAYNHPVDSWDTSKNNSMRYLFKDSVFNQDISMWDTSEVIDMENAFWRNSSFNQDISTKTITRLDGSTYTAWDMSKVTDMKSTFNEARSFNQDISNWDVSNVTTMHRAFADTDSFNQDIFIDWDTSGVTDMSNMFSGGGAVGLDIENLDTSGATTIEQMFMDNRSTLIPDISTKTVTRGDGSTYIAWDTSNVDSMHRMFFRSYSFNSNIGNWDTSSVDNMNEMFTSARAFNQDLGNWDTSSVDNMTNMFKDTYVFDQDISAWNVGSITACNEFDSGNTLTTWLETEKPNFALSCTKGI